MKPFLIALHINTNPVAYWSGIQWLTAPSYACKFHSMPDAEGQIDLLQKHMNNLACKGLTLGTVRMDV